MVSLKGGATAVTDSATRLGWTFQRCAGLAGVAFSALILLGEILGNAPDEGMAGDEMLVEFYTDSGNQYRLYGAGLIGLFAGLLFLWFLVGLRDRLSRADPSGLPTLVLAAGLVFVVLASVGGAIGTALPASLVYSDVLEITDLDTLRVLLILGNHWLAGAAASTAAIVVGGTSVTALRRRLFPRWCAWAGLAVALLLLPSMALFAGFTLVGLVAWTAAVGVWLARADRKLSKG